MVRKIADAVSGFLYLCWIPVRALAVIAKYRMSPSAFPRLVSIGWSRFVDPNDLALFEIDDPTALDFYMRRFELASITRAVNPAGWSVACALNDKLYFYRRCERFSLPHPELYAHVEDDEARVFRRPRQPGPIAAKPIAERGGKGFRLLHPGEQDLDSEISFSRFLIRSVLGEPVALIAQERITAHPALRDLAMDALPTARVTTVLDENGLPEVVTSVFRLPAELGVLTDNIKAGGILAAVDADGRLGIGRGGKFLGSFKVHPITGAQIEGRVLPEWKEVLDLARLAHRSAFCEYNLVGWDVAITQGGPVLIEGNSKPCAIVAQRANLTGLGATRFGELLRYHLSRARDLQAISSKTSEAWNRRNERHPNWAEPGERSRQTGVNGPRQEGVSCSTCRPSPSE